MGGPERAARSARPWWRRAGLLVHAVIVGALLLLFAALIVGGGSGGGANIGAGIVGLPILALGLPWTLPVWLDPYASDDFPRAAWYLIRLGPAVLNVALHAALVRYRPGHRR